MCKKFNFTTVSQTEILEWYLLRKKGFWYFDLHLLGDGASGTVFMILKIFSPRKRQFFRRKLAKIATKIFDHIIGPRNG
jgi:hypothetical protein